MSSKFAPSDPEKVMIIRDILPNITTLSVPFCRVGLFKIGGRATIGMFPRSLSSIQILSMFLPYLHPSLTSPSQTPHRRPRRLLPRGPYSHRPFQTQVPLRYRNRGFSTRPLHPRPRSRAPHFPLLLGSRLPIRDHRGPRRSSRKAPKGLRTIEDTNPCLDIPHFESCIRGIRCRVRSRACICTPE